MEYGLPQNLRTILTLRCGEIGFQKVCSMLVVATVTHIPQLCSYHPSTPALFLNAASVMHLQMVLQN